MSSRGQFIGSGPNAGIYQSKPIPANQEDLPVYLNDELLSLGGKLNNVIEGGVFPPQSELPKRYKEGMTVFFTQAIPKSDITSSGVWLYKGGKWWKMIDDPTALNQTLSVYKVTPREGTPPVKPPDNKYKEEDLNGWSYVPADVDDTVYQWLSVAALATLGDEPNVSWSEPVLFNNQGEVGPEGPAGYGTEIRYLASTDTPKITDKSSRNPVSDKGDPFTVEIPSVDHPDHSYIWSTNLTLKGNDMVGEWSDPVRYSTPDTTMGSRAYALGSKTGFPTWDPGAEGLPGPAWTKDSPKAESGQYVWMTERLEWTDGTKQGPWSYPIKLTGEDGISGPGTYTIVNDGAATTWPADATSIYTTHFGHPPVTGDVLHFVNHANTVVNTKMFDEGNWVPFASVINGNQIVNGTIRGEKIIAGASISAPKINAGEINGVSFKGTNFLANGTIQGGRVHGSNITGGTLGIGGDGVHGPYAGYNTYIAGDGKLHTNNLYASGGYFSGNVNATSGTFTGTVNANAGYFRGRLEIGGGTGGTKLRFTSSKIEVWENGSLRVRIGNLNDHG